MSEPQKQLIITGFEPFGGETVNPAWEAVRRLEGAIGIYRVHALQIPTVFDGAARAVIAAAEALDPDAILCVGQAGGRAAVTPEMVALNLRYAVLPDNAGRMPQDEPVVPGGPAAYFATVPVRRMARAMEAAGVKSAVSYSAGTFVCNDLLYTLLNRYAGTRVRVGFIHVPYLPEQAAEKSAPSLPLESAVKALRAAVVALQDGSESL